MIIGKERHDLGRPDDVGYPVRGILQNGFLYLRNYKPDRWPTGNPETGYMNTDGSPTKSWILNERRRGGNREYWTLNFDRKDVEELYYLQSDPDCIRNLIKIPVYQNTKRSLLQALEEELKQEGDPRILGNGDVFDKYPYANEAQRNFYNRYMNGEDIKAGWINSADIESKPIHKEDELYKK